MKAYLTLLLIAFCACNTIITEELNAYLKKHAPFKVYEPSKNPFRNWTDEEIRNLFKVEIRHVKKEKQENKIEIISDAPESFDAREQWPECKQEIRDQASCGSCWAFSAVEALAWRFCVATEGKTNVVLSAQDPVACDENNFGCDGGYLDYVWEYLEKTGAVTESCYPYESGSGVVPPCRDECDDGEDWVKYKSTAYKEYTSPDAIKDTLQSSGPVQTGFTVYSDFMQYESGIYKHVSGGLLGYHAVVIVGWGVEDGTKYWIAQNSWAADWGEQGYFRIAEGECQFDEDAFAGEAAV